MIVYCEVINWTYGDRFYGDDEVMEGIRNDWEIILKSLED